MTVTSISSSNTTFATSNPNTESNLATLNDTLPNNPTKSSSPEASSEPENSEAKMTNEEFQLLLSKHFNPTLSSNMSNSISDSIQEAFASFEKKLDKAEKVLDDYLAK